MTRADEVTAPAAVAPLTGRRERRKQSTRAALVETALRLFDERGYGEVTVDDVCAEVDVSSRTFFRYFTTKEQVLAEPVTTLLAVIQDALRARSSSPRVWRNLRAAVSAAVDHIEEHREDFLRTARVVREHPAALASSARALTEWEQSVRADVARQLSADPDSLYPRMLVGLSMLPLRAALDRWTEGGGVEQLRELVDEAFQAVDAGGRALARTATGA